MTDEEKRLWHCFLKTLPVKFTRQKIIGNYIIDFYCAETKTAIELDGSQHYEDEGLAKDEVRDSYLHSLGITVLRYTNIEFNKNFKGVCEDIAKNLHLPV